MPPSFKVNVFQKNSDKLHFIQDYFLDLFDSLISDWRCQACSLELREDQEHLLVCDGYEDLKENLDLRSESEMVNFYQRVMDRRRQMNWS